MGKVLKSSAETPPLAGGQIEIWKKIVDVQQHFNDLELRIRNFALIVTGAFLGLGGYAIKDGGAFSVGTVQVAVAGLVVIAAVIPLTAFYFMDRLWYHRLLEGAVEAGVEAESALKTLGYTVDLGSKVSAKSPFQVWFFGWNVRSKNKMDLFYLLLLITLVLVALALGFAIRPQPAAGGGSQATTATSPQQARAASDASGEIKASAVMQQAAASDPQSAACKPATPNVAKAARKAAPPPTASSPSVACPATTASSEPAAPPARPASTAPAAPAGAPAQAASQLGSGE
jgi:hypothetical protein